MVKKHDRYFLSDYVQVECVLKPRCKKCMEKGMGRPSRRSLYTGNVIQNLAASLSKSYSVKLFSPFISLFGFGPLGGCDTDFFLSITISREGNMSLDLQCISSANHFRYEDLL